MTNLLLPNSEKLIIAGPCALESREQLKKCVEKLKALNIKIIRASLFKPRTTPGWEGLGCEGLNILLEETLSNGLIPATEVMNEIQAKQIIEALKQYGDDAKMLLWIGSRNQNHLEQQKIAKILSKNENIFLMFKNQMWKDIRHWLGIYEHIIAAGFLKESLLICHRGFSPNTIFNFQKYRNLADFEMAKRVKEKTKTLMIIDPSHIAGYRKNVKEIIKQAQKYDFDGYMIEVHPDPENAKSDREQQLSLKEFEETLKIITNFEKKEIKIL